MGEYTWGYMKETKRRQFDASFVRVLRRVPWIPDQLGNLQRAEATSFDVLGWKPSPFLQSTIPFKPPVIEALAREAGFEPGLLDLLKHLGVTSAADLRVKLGVEDPFAAQDGADR